MRQRIFGAALAILGVALLPLFAIPATANTYFVDAARGNDANPGTSQSSPWKTLDMVNHFPFHPGDVVRLAAGSTWRETLDPQGHDNANFHGVTIAAAAGAPATINGSDPVTGWNQFTDRVYQANFAKPIFNVYADGGPGWGLAHACCLPGTNCLADSPKAYQKGHTCLIGAMTPGSWYFSGPNPLAPARPNTLYVWLEGGTDPSRHLIEAVTRYGGVQAYITGAQLDNFTLSGITIVETGIRAISLESGDDAGCCGSRDTGSGRGISGLVLRNLTIERSGTGPIDDGSYGNAITVINAAAPVVQNNRVSFAGNHGNCINVQNSNGARVSGNEVDHWNHNGIDIKGSRDVIVENNLAHDQPRFGAGYYAESSANIVFQNNRVYNVSNGFQISEHTQAIVRNNTIQQAGTAVFFGPQAISLQFTGNTCTGCQDKVDTDGIGTLSQSDNMWN